MTEQPIPEAAPVQAQLVPDWQQIAPLLLWKLLPATERSVTLTPADFDELMAAYPDGPVILFRPTPESTTVGLTSVSEAEALAASYNAALVPSQNAPTSGALQ